MKRIMLSEYVSNNVNKVPDTRAHRINAVSSIAVLSTNRCSVVKGAGVNNSIDCIDCWHMIQIMSVEAYFLTGSSFHHAVCVGAMIYQLNSR